MKIITIKKIGKQTDLKRWQWEELFLAKIFGANTYFIEGVSCSELP